MRCSARRRSLYIMSVYNMQFIQNRHKGHIGQERYETEIGKSFAVMYLDTRKINES